MCLSLRAHWGKTITPPHFWGEGELKEFQPHCSCGHFLKWLGSALGLFLALLLVTATFTDLSNVEASYVTLNTEPVSWEVTLTFHIWWTSRWTGTSFFLCGSLFLSFVCLAERERNTAGRQKSLPLFSARLSVTERTDRKRNNWSPTVLTAASSLAVQTQLKWMW